MEAIQATRENRILAIVIITVTTISLCADSTLTGFSSQLQFNHTDTECNNGAFFGTWNAFIYPGSIIQLICDGLLPVLMVTFYIVGYCCCRNAACWQPTYFGRNPVCNVDSIVHGVHIAGLFGFLLGCVASVTMLIFDFFNLFMSPSICSTRYPTAYFLLILQLVWSILALGKLALMPVIWRHYKQAGTYTEM
jgi:hypothetical protein